MAYYVGVDVGTGSARAGLFDKNGRCLSKASQSLSIHNPHPDHYEQSSDDIWAKVCACVKTVVQESGVDPTEVRGIGFDATCSLVVVATDGEPITVSTTGDRKWNVIMWMDHRAQAQAESINQSNHEVLRYVGGKISLEMETPKLMWLKQHLRDSYDSAGHFFDLPDYLTYRATNGITRSLCSTVCKWTYRARTVEGAERLGTEGWSDSYWRGIGLGDIVDGGYERIGTTHLPPGQPLPSGLCSEAASAFGLPGGTSVAVSMIDAHAGTLGVIGSDLADPRQIANRLAVIAGTSSCHMAQSQHPLDHIVETHPAYVETLSRARAAKQSIYEYLNTHLAAMATEKALEVPDLLAQSIHVLPYFHGNRSPHADPTLRGSIIGQSLATNQDALALLYLATVQALAYGTRDILAAMNSSGHNISTLYMTGGLAKNPLYVSTHANTTGCPVVLSEEEDSVLLGSAVLGAAASRDFQNIPAAMCAMNHASVTIHPNPSTVAYHQAKMRVFTEMRNDQYKYRSMMAEG